MKWIIRIFKKLFGKPAQESHHDIAESLKTKWPDSRHYTKNYYDDWYES
jgi:hypothetical protein